MRITVDTNFLVSSTQWDYSVSHKLLEKLIRDNAEIFTTTEILEEFEEVLERDFKYNVEEIKSIIKLVLQFLTIIVTNSRLDIVKEDRDDNKIIECAIESKSDYIISYDPHLLNLKEYGGIKIIKPEEAFGL